MSYCSQSCSCCIAPHISMSSAELFQVLSGASEGTHTMLLSRHQVVPAATFPTTVHLERLRITTTHRLLCNGSSHLPAQLPVSGLFLPLLKDTCGPRLLPEWKSRQILGQKKGLLMSVGGTGSIVTLKPLGVWMLCCSLLEAKRLSPGQEDFCCV